MSEIADVVAREYPEPRTRIYLNAASAGLVPRSAAEEAADLTRRRNRPDGFVDEELGRIQRRCRSALARLIGADAEEIALAPNTSFGVNLAAALVATGPPGTVVVAEGEFPANVLPFKALESRGFHVHVVPADEMGRPVEERLLAALDGSDVRALALSAVQFSSGFRADLERFGRACRARGLLFFVDAIQALGAVPLNARACHVDVLACGGQKWLCAPWGSGFAYVRRELQARFDSPVVSWLAVEGSTRFDDMLRYDLSWRSDARKYELATLGLQDYLGLARSVEIFLEAGLDAVRSHILAVQAPLLRWIESRHDVRAVTPLQPEGRRAGIVSFAPPALTEAASALEAAGVVFALREGAVRLAPHYYNTVSEMEEVVQVLDGV